MRDCDCVPGHQCDCWDYRAEAAQQRGGLDVDAMVRVAAKLACEDHYKAEHLNTIPPCAGAIQDAEYWADKMGLRRVAPQPSVPPPLPSRSCRHGIVPDQCPHCDSPGADKEEATRQAIKSPQPSVPPPLPSRSCRHGIVPDQCPHCDSPGADKEEATRQAIKSPQPSVPPADPQSSAASQPELDFETFAPTQGAEAASQGDEE